MLDRTFVRENIEQVGKALQDRGSDFNLDKFLELDDRVRTLRTEVEEGRAERNRMSEKIGRLTKLGQDTTAERTAMKARTNKTKQDESELTAVEEELATLLKIIPNIPHPSVPVGKDETANQLIRKVGEPRRFDFSPKDHVELGAALGILDMERAAKITGARFAHYWGLGARLERALINFMLDVQTRENGYQEVLPPFIVNDQTLFGTGQLPKFRADLFKLDGLDYYLVPTAEVPVTNLYRDEIIESKKLPLKLTAYTPCFRSEAGSYGKDTRGLIRQHQFNKVELVCFSQPDTSYDELERLTTAAETILQKLELPYQVVALSTGDLGFAAAKTYDLEVWLPSQQRCREISSCSNFEDFQARRANIRFRADAKAKPRLVHTLNGSGLAVGRTWVAIVENYQQPDGSVKIPKVLVPYMDGVREIR
ncbi:MAG TPA: serine--tRNA ligase [Acidobacteriota bacterium]|jgi:seryl-tRNA synthetase|nr:serine--tRNA ligase [Acidobacteriota bacterium]